MTDLALHSTPGLRAVVREQVRAVGLALRLPALGGAALLALATLFIGGEVVRHGSEIGFHPERWMLPGVLGALLPVAVWFGEDRFGGAFLWTLPVDRRAHALAKVFGGWVWLMAAIAVFVLWLLAFALLSGGNVLGPETLLMATPATSLEAFDLASLRNVEWRPEPVLWLVPFTAATGTYLLFSALVLGPRHPWRWVAGAIAAFFLLTLAMETSTTPWLRGPFTDALHDTLFGPYGLEGLLIAHTEGLRVEADIRPNEAITFWLGLPDPGRWAAATLLWLAAGGAALWAAASRHRERRRP
jgi:hypothetical protein